ncbi:hypothetical protein A3F08_02905 [Candidatus Berkelbacteria bacterium RIFCSPHIGHO2_12_FULL_36_9]|uniref:Uncharacterized protein n=1 Tax=Candidatus Berkelbacteria bacterium RIFCSPHIGHO2_12_FULL_36_9 TaxID=1797469 RepID=A0A1F5EKH3_9BACT|nr:MAG: hypothetical protein A3F08_02905 [Candidatus Berkelbacteria bacterium RIFCSPHIGHO2_12_FULL_36_9]
MYKTIPIKGVVLLDSGALAILRVLWPTLNDDPIKIDYTLLESPGTAHSQPAAYISKLKKKGTLRGPSGKCCKGIKKCHVAPIAAKRVLEKLGLKLEPGKIYDLDELFPSTNDSLTTVLESAEKVEVKKVSLEEVIKEKEEEVLGRKKKLDQAESELRELSRGVERVREKVQVARMKYEKADGELKTLQESLKICKGDVEIEIDQKK